LTLSVAPVPGVCRSLIRSPLTVLQTECFTGANTCHALGVRHPGLFERLLDGHMGGWKGEYTQ